MQWSTEISYSKSQCFWGHICLDSFDPSPAVSAGAVFPQYDCIHP